MLRKIECNFCLLVLLTGFLIPGCGSNAPAPAVSLVVRTVEDTVTLQHSSTAAFFKVTAVVRNDDSRPLQVALCGTEAQRDVGGTWTTVFTPVCTSDGLTPVASGDSVVVPVNVFGYTAPNIYPPLDPRMGPGRYRLVFGVFSVDSEAPMSNKAGGRIPSTSFMVK